METSTSRMHGQAGHPALACLLLAVAGCAEIGPTVPVLPGPGKTFEAFQADQKTCIAYTDAQLQPVADRASEAQLGALALGTVLGAGLGAAVGGGRGAGIGAAAGAIGGTAVGAGQASNSNDRLQVMYNNDFAACMVARGDALPAPVVPQVLVVAPPPVLVQPAPYYVQPAAYVVQPAPSAPAEVTPSAEAAEGQSGLVGPAAAAVERSLTTGEAIRCTSPDGADIACQAKRNHLRPNLYYGDAGGTGAESDVLAITSYQGDPTGNAEDVSVAYFHRSGGSYRFVRTFPKVHLSDLAPSTTVEFLPGHVRFTGVTMRPDDSAASPTGRTPYLLDLR